MKVILDENIICNEYLNTKIGIESIALKYHVGKKRIKEILAKYGIQSKKRGGQNNNEAFIIEDLTTKKYINDENYHYIVIDKNTDFQSNDINNKGGILTTYIKKQYNIEIPTLYDRQKYYKKTGDYWWEQYLTYIKVENRKTKKCPYCDWETIDIENKSGAFEMHLFNEHNKTIQEYLTEYPEDIHFFQKYKKKLEKENRLKDKENYVICPICGKKFEKLTELHISKVHNLSWNEFKSQYPHIEILSNNMLEQCKNDLKKGNLYISKNRFISKYEKEIQEFLENFNVKFSANRQLLIGKEIDLLIEDKKIGIEFDGLKFHTEFFGKKSHRYHLDKTIKCNEKGYGLIHIFEDEYVNHKDIVLSKIKHLLHIDDKRQKIYARKCTIKEIYKYQAKDFGKYHIQGFYSSSVYLGCYFNEQLVAVMSFKNGNVKNNGWELTRFATDYNYICCGVGSKMFKYFIKNYMPYTVVSFADRRWTIDINNNLYTKLNFKLTKISSPDYYYYNEKIDRYKRVHKLLMSKKIMIKKYGFNENMTEIEMAKALGYDRIWNCGLLKYVYTNPNYEFLTK